MDILSGKSIVITGAGRGIGASYARLCAAEGAVVVVADIDGRSARQVTSEIGRSGGIAYAWEVDVSDWDGAEALIAYCVKKTGKIDGLVNNAAIMYMSQPGADSDPARVRRLFEVNVFGVMACGNAAIRQMRDQGFGSIINISSGAHMGMKYIVCYGATKGAVASLTYGWTLENEDVHDLRINAVQPRGKTTMNPDRETLHSQVPDYIPNDDSPPPENNAPLVVFLLSDMAKKVKGQMLRIDGPHLSLVAHPAVLDPVLENSQGWSVEAIDKAFRSKFKDVLVPTGVTSRMTASYRWAEVRGPSALHGHLPSSDK